MPGSLQQRMQSVLAESGESKAGLSDWQAAYGGSINQCYRFTLKDNSTYFVKTHYDAGRYPGMYSLEHEALDRLGSAGVIRVPRVVASGADFILMEAFSEGTKKSDWAELTGRQLALLHRHCRENRFGFNRDNYIGTTVQPNGWSQDWLGFWREHRLGYQLKILSAKLAANDSLLQLGHTLLEKLDDYLAGIQEKPVLLHGDLWSGNAAADEQGNPIIFDPASYYGHREAEIGMMRMFGGFGPECEAAYQEVWPFEDGSEERFILYQLYHEMNHLILFGDAYYQACLGSIRRLV